MAHASAVRFEFVPYGRRAPPGSAGCDGLVPGAVLDLSHWPRNRTPARLKADTSVEIVLRFVRERSAHDIARVVNNHFDTDGVLAVWCALHPEVARAHERLVIAAAEVGDFDERPEDPRGLWLDAAVATLAGQLSGVDAYRKVLPLLDDVISNLSAREDLWGTAYQAFEEERRRAEEGGLTVERVGRIAMFVPDPRMASASAVFSGPVLHENAPDGVDRWLVARPERGNRWSYRYERPRYAWADTVSRPKIPIPRRGPMKAALGPDWSIKGRNSLTELIRTRRPVRVSPVEVAIRVSEADPPIDA